jgi:lipid A 4'-phosphatase
VTLTKAKPLTIYVALTALTLAVFALWPGVDLAVARLFFHGGGFMGGDVFLRFLRGVFADLPFVVLAAYAALWALHKAGRTAFWAPSGRAMIFLIATMAIAPGLVVNLGFKDHWHRPRPYQTDAFNGAYPFRPWYETDGGCAKNCSFVSGEASTGFWMVAPASLLPPPVQAPAVGFAFAFGAGAGLLRMAFGGHYLSDVILAGLFTLIVVEAARRVIRPPDGQPSPGAGNETAAEVVEAALRGAAALPLWRRLLGERQT